MEAGQQLFDLDKKQQSHGSGPIQVGREILSRFFFSGVSIGDISLLQGLSVSTAYILVKLGNGSSTWEPGRETTSNAAVSNPASGYSERTMAMRIQTRTQGAVWLFCALIVLMSAVSPLCGACDGLGTVHSSLPHAIDKIPPSSPVDQCNGVCSCCGFHWLPVSGSRKDQIALLLLAPTIEKQRFVSRHLAPPFQPPRV